MRYAAIRKMDISNGKGLGVALFVQGCHFHCKNCFNKETWDFDGGKEFTCKEVVWLLSQLCKPQYTRLSVLGGEPLEPENIYKLTELFRFIKTYMPEKKIWLYTGYKLENCTPYKLFNYVDVLVDGQYIDELKDMSYPWAGSTNQRVIDLQKSKEFREVVLLETNE